MNLRGNGLSAIIQNVFYIDHFNSQVISYFISIAMTVKSCVSNSYKLNLYKFPWKESRFWS